MRSLTALLVCSALAGPALCAENVVAFQRKIVAAAVADPQFDLAVFGPTALRLLGDPTRPPLCLEESRASLETSVAQLRAAPEAMTASEQIVDLEWRGVISAGDYSPKRRTLTLIVDKEGPGLLEQLPINVGLWPDQAPSVCRATALSAWVTVTFHPAIAISQVPVAPDVIEAHLPPRGDVEIIGRVQASIEKVSKRPSRHEDDVKGAVEPVVEVKAQRIQFFVESKHGQRVLIADFAP